MTLTTDQVASIRQKLSETKLTVQGMSNKHLVSRSQFWKYVNGYTQARRGKKYLHFNLIIEHELGITIKREGETNA